MKTQQRWHYQAALGVRLSFRVVSYFGLILILHQIIRGEGM